MEPGWLRHRPRKATTAVKKDSKTRQAEKELRSVVNSPQVFDVLSKNVKDWDQLCSAMDLVGDTNAAIEAFKGASPTKKIGRLYLNAYGLLQSLFVQSDAVRYIREVVGLERNLSQSLVDIREIRNRSVGHPARYGDKSYGISRISLSQGEFTLTSFAWDKPSSPEVFAFSDLIIRQELGVVEEIRQIIAHLNKA